MLQSYQPNANFKIDDWTKGKYYAQIITNKNQKMMLTFMKQ